MIERNGGVGRHRRPESLGRSLLTARIPRATEHAGHLVADGGSPGVGHSVWLAAAGAVSAPAFVESELPVWALERIAVQFAAAGARFGVCHGPGPARTGLAPVPGVLAPGWLAGAELYRPTGQVPTLDLALVLADPCAFEPAPTLEVTRPFWRTLREAVRPGGLVLVHTHQGHDKAGLVDPVGALVRDASRAGLGYLQHLVLVHTRLMGQSLAAADPVVRRAPAVGPHRPVHRRVHTDLLAFTAA